MVWVRDGLITIRLLLSFALVHRISGSSSFTPSTEVRGGFICGYLYLRPFFLWSVPSTITDNDLLLVVSRGPTLSKKMQIADLPSGTMRRISRARSIVSGVELWHPAKPLLENRVVFVHCIIMTACSCHHATLHLSIGIILHLLASNYFRKARFVF